MSIAPSEEAKRAYAATRAEVEHLQARLAAVTDERDMYHEMIRIALQGTQAGTYIAALTAERDVLRAALENIASGEHRLPQFDCHCGCMTLYARQVLQEGKA